MVVKMKKVEGNSDFLRWRQWRLVFLPYKAVGACHTNHWSCSTNRWKRRGCAGSARMLTSTATARGRCAYMSMWCEAQSPPKILCSYCPCNEATCAFYFYPARGSLRSKKKGAGLDQSEKFSTQPSPQGHHAYRLFPRLFPSCLFIKMLMVPQIGSSLVFRPFESVYPFTPWTHSPLR